MYDPVGFSGIFIDVCLANFWVVFRKMNNFGCMKNLSIFFGGHHKTEQICAYFRLFLKVNVGGASKIQIFF